MVSFFFVMPHQKESHRIGSLTRSFNTFQEKYYQQIRGIIHRSKRFRQSVQLMLVIREKQNSCDRDSVIQEMHNRLP